MKNTTILHGFRNSVLGAACSLLLAGAVQGKPDEDKDKDGKPGHSEKHKGEGNRENKDGDAHKEAGKEHNEAGKDRKEAEKDHKEAGKDRKEAGKERNETGKDRNEAGKDRNEAARDHNKAGRERNEAARDHRNEKTEQNQEWRKRNFRADDRTSVIRYFSEYREKEHGLPPGLAQTYLRGRTLPSGWQTRVRSGYVIGDDLKDYFLLLEYSLFPGLEVVPDTRLYLYGNRIVRVYEPRREVIDVIEVPTIRFE